MTAQPQTGDPPLRPAVSLLADREDAEFSSGECVVKNLPFDAGDAGSIPSKGTKIPHAAGQLSLRATTSFCMS